MPKKRYNAEEIIHKLREADVLLSQGKSVSHQEVWSLHSRVSFDRTEDMADEIAEMYDLGKNVYK
jgi:hypothetical protein